jgi:8-oxo-dGTP pyrophosphatase MutT (NUDIX family)
LAATAARIQARDLTRLEPPVGAAPRHSAVLMLFGEGAAGPDVLLTERAAGLRAHAGQVSFPGGAVDPGDRGPRGAALREAEEETGLDPAGVHVADTLPDLYLPVSDFTVTPVLAWWHRPSPVRVVDAGEVSRVVRVAVADLMDPANRFQVTHPSGFVGPGFDVAGLFVWGFTAGLLARFLELAGWERPWDAGRRVPAPPAPAQLTPHDAAVGGGVEAASLEEGADPRTPAAGGGREHP